MNNQQLLLGFKRCRREIKDLREINKLQKLELDSMNKVLKAINNNQGDISRGLVSCSDSIICNIDETIEYLSKTIEREQIKEDLEERNIKAQEAGL